jgi:hypothetical protein
MLDGMTILLFSFLMLLVEDPFALPVGRTTVWLALAMNRPHFAVS